MSRPSSYFHQIATNGVYVALDHVGASERGDTLVEVLLAIVIVSIAAGGSSSHRFRYGHQRVRGAPQPHFARFLGPGSQPTRPLPTFNRRPRDKRDTQTTPSPAPPLLTVQASITSLLGSKPPTRSATGTIPPSLRRAPHTAPLAVHLDHLFRPGQHGGDHRGLRPGRPHRHPMEMRFHAARGPDPATDGRNSCWNADHASTRSRRRGRQREHRPQRLLIGDAAS